MTTQPTLARRLSFTWITLYGLGTIIGAGIYALVGVVASRAGAYTPLSFFVAAVLAASSALTFAELSSRYPRSAGEAVYVYEGFGVRPLAAVVGCGVVLVGVLSAATVCNGLAGYLAQIVEVPRSASIAVAVVVLSLVAVWGIAESVAMAGVITVLEIAGLMLVVWSAREALLLLPERLAATAIPPPAAIPGIFSGAVVAFFAFIGFEDMVNVAEEVRDVRRTLPAAILTALVVTSVLYAVVAAVSVTVVSPEKLAASDAPLALVYDAGSPPFPNPLGWLGVLAMVNGALIQIIMASRVLYGLAWEGSLPAVFGRVHPRTRTPVVATLVVSAIVLALAEWFPIGPLARAASLVTLAVFASVNLALVRIKRRDPAPVEARQFPSWVPAMGFVVSAGVLLVDLAGLTG